MKLMNKLIDKFIDLFQRNGFGNVLSDDGIHPKHTIYEMPVKQEEI